MKMRYNYLCVEQSLFHVDIGNYISFGIALNDSNNIQFSDVSCEKEAVESLVAVLNNFQVETSHVKSLIEDLLY